MLYSCLLFFFFYLPLQIAINPSEGVDLASARLFIPLFALCWLAFCLKNKRCWIPFSWHSFLFFSFLYVASFSLFFSQNITWSLRKLAFLLSIAPLYFIIPSLLSTEKKRRKALSYLLLGGAVVATIGIMQFLAQFIFGLTALQLFWSQQVIPYFLGRSFAQAVIDNPSWFVHIGNRDYFRTISIFPDPHMLSFYLGMLLPWSVGLFITERKKRIWYGVISILLLIADLLTFSRGGYLGLIFGFLFIIPHLQKNFQKWVLISLGFLFLLFLIIPSNPVSQRLSSTFDPYDGSNQGRIETWKQAFSVIIDHPLGTGLGNYPLEIKPSASYREPIYAHSVYLDIAAELGICSLIIWLLFIVSAICNFLRMAKKDPLYLAGAASIALYAGHCLVENPLFSVHVFCLLLIILSFGNTHRHEIS